MSNETNNNNEIIKRDDSSSAPAENEKKSLPMIALRGKVVFPKTFISFDVGRQISLAAVNAAAENNTQLFIAAQKNALVDTPSKNDLNRYGVVARVAQIIKLPGGNVKVSVEALYRAFAENIKTENGMFVAETVREDYIREDGAETEAYFRLARQAMLEYTLFDKQMSKDVLVKLSEMTDPDEFIDNVLSVLTFKESKCQELLEERVTIKRLENFTRLLSEELEISKIERKISAQVRKNIDKGQKEFYLREQLKAIHTELGDDEDEKKTLYKQIKDKNLPPEAEEKALKELARLDKINPSSPDYSIILNYLDWIKELPFNTYTQDTENLSAAKAVLNADHFGLESVKERIVEYLAVLQLTKKIKGPILCFVGPPGVGKTSIAKSVARALGRKFVRMSLGGVRDEAEIRGHRRTYVGAMPGRIVYGLRNAGSSNPVFLLDEIDKLSSDIHGDPASALLEVLDPEQNSTFRDRYLEIPYDLSKVLFITTANTLDTIPYPLLDRMEVIEINGYTEEEKTEIALRYLVPKQIAENGLTADNLSMTEGGIREIIEGYTMEAGVRNLEREIGTVCRKVAIKVAENKVSQRQVVNEKKVREYLGVRKFSKDKPIESDEVGSATGLAWTAFGGTTLIIEVGLMRGKGEILLTGKLGDVMKESARAGISYIRSNAAKYGIDEEVFDKTDIHIHVPEGATPKDGPSAGITMATAILSAFTKKPVKKNVAMTGEITLRGKVLPIGGLKEKTLAASRVGIENIVMPKGNKKDLEEIPKEIRAKLNFIPVENVDEVFAAAIRGF